MLNTTARTVIRSIVSDIILKVTSGAPPPSSTRYPNFTDLVMLSGADYNNLDQNQLFLKDVLNLVGDVFALETASVFFDQLTSIRKPLFNPTGLNGRPSFQFHHTGNTSWFDFILNFADEYTIFMVLETQAGAGEGYILTGTAGGGTPAIISKFLGQDYEWFNGGERYTFGPSLLPGPHILCVSRKNNGLLRLYVDGVKTLETPTTVDQPAVTFDQLGSVDFTPQGFRGNIGLWSAHANAFVGSETEILAINNFYLDNWFTFLTKNDGTLLTNASGGPLDTGRL